MQDYSIEYIDDEEYCQWLEEMQEIWETRQRMEQEEAEAEAQKNPVENACSGPRGMLK